MNFKSVFTVCGVVYYFLQDDIRKFIYNCWDFAYNKFAQQILINIEQNPKLIFSIKQEIIEQLDLKKQGLIIANDASLQPFYDINRGNGSFTLGFQKSTIYIKFGDEVVYVYSYMNKMENLQNFLDKIFKKYCSSDKNLIFFTSDETNWSFPIFRKPRSNIDLILSKNDNINRVILDLNEFFDLDNRRFYRENDFPYRKGYLLQGPPGSGKSTAIEIMAIKHNMSVYLVNLNSKEMTDTLLINLISKVPAKSIIVFEEIDKQLETLNKNKNNLVSFGGILSAIDGPQRLDESCIVVMTTNDLKFLENDNDKKKSLLRKGRIDEVYKFV